MFLTGLNRKFRRLMASELAWKILCGFGSEKMCWLLFYCFLYRVMASMSEVMEMTTLAMDADALQMVKKGLFFTCAVRLGST